MPCENHVDGCGSAGGALPEDDGNDGTTQPGFEDGGGTTGLPQPGGLGPLILTDPDQGSGPTVVIVRSPTYGLVLPGPEDHALWEEQVAAFESSMDDVFAAAADVAGHLSDVCGRPGCD